MSRPSGSYGLNSLQSSIVQGSKEIISSDEFIQIKHPGDCLETALMDINQVPRLRLNLLTNNKKLESSDTEIRVEDIDECLLP